MVIYSAWYLGDNWFWNKVLQDWIFVKDAFSLGYYPEKVVAV